MPYTKEELENLQFYQELAHNDEIEYRKMIQKRIESGNIATGVLRDSSTGHIICFEQMSSTGDILESYSEGDLHTIEMPEDGYFDYLETDELNNIIDREFKEF